MSDVDFPASLPHLMSAAVDLLETVEPASSSLGRLKDLLERLTSSRLHIAVLGQFKRGKSSLLNALLGADLLPTAVLPLTSVPIFIASGRPPSLRIHYKADRPAEEGICDCAADLRDRLYAVATEEANPHNRLGVERIDIRYPAPWLADGTVLIDTPGIGSSHRHNTDTTLHFLPQCDAGLFILSPDPPITEAELSFLDNVKAQVPRLVFILNKVDYLDPSDSDKVVAFLQLVLQKQLHSAAPPYIHCISARQALAARQAEDPSLMAASGLVDFEDRVLRPLAQKKFSLLQIAINGKARAALADARLDVGLAIRSLRMPIEQLAACVTSFQDLLPQFEIQRQNAQDMLTGDRKRALQQLEEEADQLRRRASQHLKDVIDSAFSDQPSRAEAAARDALMEAIPVFFDEELGRLSDSFTAHIRQLFLPHQKRAVELIDAVRRTAAELFELPWQPACDGEFLELSRQPYWVTQELTGALIPVVAGRLDWFLPTAKRLDRLRKRLLDDATTMIARNVENLRWATLQNLDTAFRRFGAELDRGLAEAIIATHGSISTAYERRRSEADRIDPEEEHLSSVAAALDDIGRHIEALAAEGDGPPEGWS